MAEMSEFADYANDREIAQCVRKLVKLGQSSNSLALSLASRGFGEYDPLTEPHSELLAEGFVNGNVFTTDGARRVTYRSPFADIALGEAGLSRSELRDLSRSPSIDQKIERAPWATAFLRIRLEDSVNNPKQRIPNSNLSLEPAREFFSGDSVGAVVRLFRHGNLWLGSVCDEPDHGFLAVLAVRSVQFPIIVKPYLLPFCGLSSKELELSRIDKKFLHPLWILVPNAGSRLVSRSELELAESLASFDVLFESASHILAD